MEAGIRFFDGLSQAYVHQVREWGEIITGFETRNKYKVLDESGSELGFIAEQRQGFAGTLFRFMLRSHRPMHIKVWNHLRSEVLDIARPFYWFFSDMSITSDKQVIGHVRQRFAFIYKKYDLIDRTGRPFAYVRAPFWRLWSFPIFDSRDQERGIITKKWGGFMREIFTDEDKFKVEFKSFTSEQKAIIFAAAISIDLDYFEENHSNQGGAI